MLLKSKTKGNIVVPCRTYQRKVYVDMLNTVKSVLADVSSGSLQSKEVTSANTLFTAFSMSTSTLRWYILRSPYDSPN